METNVPNFLGVQWEGLSTQASSSGVRPHHDLDFQAFDALADFKPDTIIIGSGYGGLLPAWRLTRAGAKVLLIERGPRRDPRDFQMTWDALYFADIYDVAFSTSMTDVYRSSRTLGGGSVMNAMMHQRVPSSAFDWVDPDTGKRAWPKGLSRATLDPYYQELEELLEVRQLEPYEIPKVGASFGRIFKDAGLSCDAGRFNISDRCVRKGFCEAGCTNDGKNTLLKRVLPEALATGNLRVLTGTTVANIQFKQGVYHANCIPTGAPFYSNPVATYQAPKMILAAGPTGTVPLLWRSRYRLSRLSQALGYWYHNNGDVNLLFEMPEHYPDHEGWKSTNNSGMISYAFWESHRATVHSGFSALGVLAGLEVRFPGELPWGLQHKHYARDKIMNRLIPMNAMMQIPADMFCGIDKQGGPRIVNGPMSTITHHTNTLYQLLKEVAEKAGAKVLITGPKKWTLDRGGQHMMGGARMSDSSYTGVVNPEGEVYGYPGLTISDASSIPSTIGINPALTIGANALRIADHLLKNAGARS